MNYPIPTSIQEIVNLRQNPVSEEVMLCAIAGTIKISREDGKSLEDITAEVLAEDNFLDVSMRRWLSQAVTTVWHFLDSDSASGSDRHRGH
jgi:hypothetical protein